MTAGPPVSVVVVGRTNPETLVRCLSATARQYHDRFEIVVVAPTSALHRLDMAPELFGRLKRLRDEAGTVAAARNAGLKAAAGDIVVFLDGSAVPEPRWLAHLTGPFADPRVKSAGGVVLGPNGLSVAREPRSVDAAGRTGPVPLRGSGPALFSGRPGVGILTDPTTMAFRRATLMEVGGFDPAFDTLLGEADMNLRLAHDGHVAALVPLAVVHGGTTAETPDIATLRAAGRALGLLLRRHAAPDSHARAMAKERAERRRDLLRRMIAGLIEPRDVGHLLSAFDAGYAEAQGVALADPPKVTPPDAEFLRFPVEEVARGRHRPVAGLAWSRERVLREATELALDGFVTSAFNLSPAATPHRVRYRPEGIWMHEGGLFGPSRPGDPAFRAWTLRARVARELSELRNARGPAETAYLRS